MYLNYFKTRCLLKLKEKEMLPLKSSSKPTHQMDNDFIATKVLDISTKISNAFGLELSRCYSYDNTFSWDLMGWFRR